jgi:tetratricopeptide (TPR) repeat protein
LAFVAVFLAYRTYVAESRWTDARFGELFETAQLAAIEGDLPRSGKAIEEAEQLGAPATQLALLRGQLALQSGEFQDACDILEGAVQDMPQSLAAHALLMNAYRANEQHEKRAGVASRLPGLKPVTLQDYLLLGQAQSHADFSAAQSILDEAVERYKTSVVARLIRGGALVVNAMDTADPQRAELALDDLRIASELLEPNALLLSRVVEARLTAATAYMVAGDAVRRQQHLDEARAAADALKAFPDHYQSHTWRAYYFDYVGDDGQAIEAWRAMTDHIIGYLVLALYRSGEFQEAITLCEQRMAKYPHGRFSEFLRAFALAASVKTPKEVLAAFSHPVPEPLDPRYEHCFKYTIYCLAGDLESAKKFSHVLRRSTPTMPDSDERWRKALDYTCGELSEQELLEQLAMSRMELSKGQFIVGITHLAAGNRERARRHFRASRDLKVVASLQEHLSRALLAQLDRDPTWPAWIPASNATSAQSD